MTIRIMPDSVRRVAKLELVRDRTVAPSATMWPALAVLPLLVAGRFKAVGLSDVAGIDLTLLAAAFLCAVAGWLGFRGRGISIGGTAVLWFFLSVVALSHLESAASDYANEKSVLLFFLTVPVILAVLVLIRSIKDLRGLLLTWVAAGTLIALASLLLGERSYRFTLGGNYLDTSYIVGTALAVLVFAASDRWIPLWVTIPLMVVNSVVMLALGARGPLLALAAAVVWRVVTARSGLRAVFGVIASLALATTLGWMFAGQGAKTRYSLIFEAGVREDLRNAAVQTWLSQPFAGVGWGSFGSSSGSGSFYPHNIFAEAAAEMGVVGLSAVILLIMAALVRSWRYRFDSTCAAAGGIAVFWLVQAQFSGDLSSRFVWLALVPCLVLQELFRRGPMPTVAGAISRRTDLGGRRQVKEFN